MKIALCMKGKFSSGSKYAQTENSEYSQIAYQFYKNNILDLNDVDVFVHSWDIEYKEEITNLYHPVDSTYDDNNTVITTSCGKRKLNDRSYSIVSNWYSIMKSVDLMRKHEQTNDMKYDLVVIGRFDVGILEPIDFLTKTLSLDDTLYHSGPDPIHGVHCKCRRCTPSDPNYEIPDLLFFSSSDNIYKFSRLYEECDVDDIIKADSNHKSGAGFVKKIGLKRDCITQTKTFNEWTNLHHSGNITIVRWMDICERDKLLEQINR